MNLAKSSSIWFFKKENNGCMWAFICLYKFQQLICNIGETHIAPSKNDTKQLLYIG